MFNILKRLILSRLFLNIWSINNKLSSSLESIGFIILDVISLLVFVSSIYISKDSVVFFLS